MLINSKFVQLTCSSMSDVNGSYNFANSTHYLYLYLFLKYITILITVIYIEVCKVVFFLKLKYCDSRLYKCTNLEHSFISANSGTYLQLILLSIIFMIKIFREMLNRLRDKQLFCFISLQLIFTPIIIVSLFAHIDTHLYQ